MRFAATLSANGRATSALLTMRHESLTSVVSWIPAPSLGRLSPVNNLLVNHRQGVSNAHTNPMTNANGSPAIRVMDWLPGAAPNGGMSRMGLGSWSRAERIAGVGVVVAVLVVGALILGSFGAPVPLLTNRGEPVCDLAGTTGMLIVDAKAGTAVIQEDMSQLTVPVIWPAGYTGRKSGDQVEVLDTTGHVVARTVQRYSIGGGYGDDGWLDCGVDPPAPLPS